MEGAADLSLGFSVVCCVFYSARARALHPGCGPRFLHHAPAVLLLSLPRKYFIGTQENKRIYEVEVGGVSSIQLPGRHLGRAAGKRVRMAMGDVYVSLLYT